MQRVNTFGRSAAPWSLVSSFLLLLAACSQTPSPPRPPCSTHARLGTLCGFENPEDLAYAPSKGVLIAINLRREVQGGFLSAMPLKGGLPERLWPPVNDEIAGSGGAGFARASAIGEPGCGLPDADIFAPHGVYLDTRDAVAPLLYVVNHGGRESIEIFSFGNSGERSVLFWSACIELPAGTSGNDVAVAPDGEVIVSNYMPPGSKRWSYLKSALGWSTGDIMLWNREDRWRSIPGTAAATPNGVEVSEDGKWVYYTSTGGQTIHRVGRDGSGAKEAAIDGLPDNLTWTKAGSLLVTTHASGLDFLKCVGDTTCRSPWSAFEVDSQTLQVTRIVQHDGDSVGAVAAALEVGDTLYFSAVFGDRIGILKRDPEPGTR